MGKDFGLEIMDGGIIRKGVRLELMEGIMGKGLRGIRELYGTTRRGWEWRSYEGG